jgi:gliding motility-associated lipoprotein GldD
MQRLFSFFILLLLFASCRPETYTPKPRGYARVDFPKRAYIKFEEAGFPYSFEIPVYSHVEHDTLFLGKKPENPYWINILFPSLGGQIYVSYKEISATQPLSKLLQDSHEMSFTVHSKRADYIDENAFQLGNRVYGIIYDVGGNAASSYQFIATDSVKHFLRGALYFDVTPNADSLKPINEFLKKDLEHLLQTLTWHN